MKQLSKNKLLLFHIILVASLVAVSIFVVWPIIKSQKSSAPIQETNCIKNKDQAIKILLGTDMDLDTETPTATYKRGVEARGGEVFFEENSMSDDSFKFIDVGEKLKNGSKLLHARYSYKVYACDIDLDKEDMVLSGNEKKYQFDFTNNNETQDQFADETKTCQQFDPTTQTVDIDDDGQKEIVANCFRGGTSNGINLFVYRLKDNKIDQIGSLDTETNYKAEDCNSDGIKDIVTHLRNVEFGDGGLSTWKSSVYCNHWDKKTNNFAQTKIGEE